MSSAVNCDSEWVKKYMEYDVEGEVDLKELGKIREI